MNSNYNDGKLPQPDFGQARSALVQHWKRESLETTEQWPSVAKAILARIQTNPPEVALNLLKADREKTGDLGVSSYIERAIKGVQTLIDMSRNVPQLLPPDPEGMNDDRAGWAGAALKAFRDVTHCDHEDAVSDLLANLMHHCDRSGLSFEEELERARRNYAEETYEARRSDATSSPGPDM